MKQDLAVSIDGIHFSSISTDISSLFDMIEATVLIVESFKQTLAARFTETISAIILTIDPEVNTDRSLIFNFKLYLNVQLTHIFFIP